MTHVTSLECDERYPANATASACHEDSFPVALPFRISFGPMKA
jgi:hypothetical protein